jgi:hypothetical protein
METYSIISLTESGTVSVITLSKYCAGQTHADDQNIAKLAGYSF